MLADNIKMKGGASVYVYRGDSGLTEEYHFNNLVVKTGTDFVAARIVGTSKAIMSHMAIGSGEQAPIAAHTALQTELGRSPLDGTVIEESDVVYTATFPQGVGTGSVTEAGLFNDATAGDMFSRVVFGVINKGENDSIVLVWRISSLSG